jgi:hypothetical protein
MLADDLADAKARGGLDVLTLPATKPQEWWGATLPRALDAAPPTLGGRCRS